jgi:hypothetical protein
VAERQGSEPGQLDEQLLANVLEPESGLQLLALACLVAGLCGADRLACSARALLRRGEPLSIARVLGDEGRELLPGLPLSADGDGEQTRKLLALAMQSRFALDEDAGARVQAVEAGSADAEGRFGTGPLPIRVLAPRFRDGHHPRQVIPPGSQVLRPSFPGLEAGIVGSRVGDSPLLLPDGARLLADLARFAGPRRRRKGGARTVGVRRESLCLGLEP